MKAKFSFLFGIFSLISTTVFAAPQWTIAIDPGHGGKDPGAIGKNLGIYEKNVTLSIARELKALLDKDPNFKGVLTRSSDYYISVPERSEIARKFKANFLISIHADSSLNPSQRGASVWVLSNRRANDEIGQWLEDDEKRSDLLGGTGKVLLSHNDKYLDQTVLDLQFGHSQRTGYELGNSILRRFARVTPLSRSTPQHASLGVLRSPDIPSVLVETGFLSNMEEEQKLNTIAYRRRIAYMIYEGLVAYRNGNLKTIVVLPSDEQDSKSTKLNNQNNEKSDRTSDVKDSGIRHKVKPGESIGSLANKYDVKVSEIIELNKLKRKELWLDETIKIPDNGKGKKVEEKPKSDDKAKADNKGKNSKIVEAEKAVSKKEQKQEKAENKKEPEKKSNDKKDTSSKGNEKKDDGKKEIPLYHTVKADQTIYAISREYNVPVNRLLKLNPTLKNGKVVTGQKIKLKEK